jgi:Amt family ammonium transporter
MLGAGAVSVFSFVGTVVIATVINVFIKNRVSEEAELEGLDTAIHGESAYEFVPVGGSRGGGGGVPAGARPRETVDA